MPKRPRHTEMSAADVEAFVAGLDYGLYDHDADELFLTELILQLEAPVQWRIAQDLELKLKD